MPSKLHLRTLFEGPGKALPLPAPLASFYGKLAFKHSASGPLVVGNFVSTLDGVVSLDSKTSSGASISGGDPADRMLMGLLRASADAVMMGAGTLRPSRRSLLTPANIYPRMAKPYAELRRRLGKPEAPLNVIVSESGDLDLSYRLFKSGEVPVMILTGSAGAKRLAKKKMPAWVRVRVVPGRGGLKAAGLIKALGLSKGQVLLVEGGPHLMDSFIKEKALHELFLTIAAQVAGRADRSQRPGFVAGRDFAPSDPRWAQLVGVKKGGDHLFLRYAFK